MQYRLLRRTVLAAAALVVAAPVLAQPKCEDPRVLKFSLVPTQDSVRELTYYKPILDMLQKNTGKRIEFYMPTSTPRWWRRCWASGWMWPCSGPRAT